MLLVTIQLVRINQVVPDAVKTADNRSDRGKECITHPNGQYCVFLAEGLTGRNLVTIQFSNLTTEIKLQAATQQRNHYKPCLSGDIDCRVDEAAGSYSYGKSERNSPKIE